jgi:N-methylhydantoinase B
VRINGEGVDPKRQYLLQRGDTVTLATLAGAGTATPRERSCEAVALDRREGYVTKAASCGNSEA